MSIFRMLLTASLSLVTLPASAQFLPAELFGQADLTQAKQSLGGSARDIAQQGHTFEPIADYGTDSDLRRYAQSVFRLDMLVENEDGERGVALCTATLIAPQVLLTNAHCIAQDSSNIIEALAWYNLIDQDGKTAQSYQVLTRAFESDTDLDYALVQISDALPDTIPTVSIVQPDSAQDREPLKIVHHPQGLPQRLSQFRCLAVVDTAEPDRIMGHRCDTLQGSSGALVVNEALEPIALHHTAGLRADDSQSYNRATYLSRIIAASAYLQQWQAYHAGRNVSSDTPSTTSPAQQNTPAKPQTKGNVYNDAINN